MKGYTEENLSVKERAKLAWTVVCFVRLWKAWIEMSSYTVESSFISLQTYNDMTLAGHSLVISMKLFAEHFPNEHFHPKVFGSDSCERLFARLRGFYRGKSNLCMLDILDICGRILKLEELKYKDVYQKETPMSWSMTTEQDILSGSREAERDVLKTVERLGMLPLLTAGNILRKDKEGEITYLNPGMESTLLAEERRREEEKKKKKMGEPEDMSICLLKEVLDDLNVTYRASEKKRHLIEKVRQARERLQESHCQQDTSHFASYRNNDYTEDQSHWHNGCTFKASLFPLIYYDERKERLLHLLFHLLFLFELVALYLEVLLYQEVVCFIVMVYSLYLGLVRYFVTEFFRLWME